ncbi:T9SS type A sorting domain-containing protein [Flammeovirga aprica]|uniref:T9SS type A sorting domain-containing protein n=1 Tax=Flammeovirga aprica JL-4 TaxID=694437 RepID=A0A7X9RVX4_9BACT|nr:T9SS type A sorting domain-containing protein [Flammeovirga aprica]NME69697.1 T9SS type A sorting domain-containing protein [Flammeovirga aprica JL-4]
MNNMRYITFTILSLLSIPLLAQTSKVDVNFNVKHTVGEVSTFEREKFIGVHAGIRENDWTRYGSSSPSDIKDDFMNKKNVYFGRNTGNITWNINSVLNEDPNRPGFVNLDEVRIEGEKHRNNYLNNSAYYSYADRNKTHILATQYHPFWPDGKLTNKGWAFSQADTEDEPFGTATGEYCAHFIKEFYGSGSEIAPEYFEVINEPVYEMFGCEDCGETDEGLEKIFKYHNTIAKEVKKVNPTQKVGGFTTAFPNFDYDNFQRWEKRWNKFMDMAGENMDFWSIHLYDWPTFQNKRIMRKGSNLEATLDMMDHASYDKFGVVKPTLVSEYGAQVHSMMNKQWSSERDWYYLVSTNSMLMTFMDRTNTIAKALPFVVLKATWGTVGDVPYNWRLLRGEDEPGSLSGTWIYTDLVKFYELWSEVEGTRVDHISENIDIQSDAYVDGNIAYVILNNLTLENQLVELNVAGLGDDNVDNVKIRHLYSNGGKPVMEENTFNVAPAQASLKPESTMIIRYELKSNVDVNETSDETKYFASTYYQPITTEAMTFDFSKMDLVENGEAKLRIGLGRAHGLSLKPTVKVNGQAVDVPQNIQGDLQTQRRSFFGVIEIPLDYETLEESNTVSIQFPDNGGHISSVNMRVYNFSLPIERSFNSLEPPTSIAAEQLKEQILLYPNPSKGGNVKLFFKGNSTIDNLKLLDIAGRTIETIPAKGNEITINTAQLKSGIYLIQAQIDGVVVSKKLMVD